MKYKIKLALSLVQMEQTG